MSVVDDGRPGGGLVQRVRDILTRPTATWQIIDGEPATIGGLYRGYVMILAAIPAVCGFVGMTLFGVGAFGLHYKPSILNAALSALVGYGLTLAGVFVMALIIDALAPSFGGQKNRIQAFKVAAYSGTAAWLAGIFQLIPLLSILSVVGLYSLYLFWKGLPQLMKTPPEKTLGYVIVVIVLAVVFWMVVGAITAPITRMGQGAFGDRDRLSGTLTVPGVGSIDMAEAEKASRRMEKAARTGKAELAPVDSLKAVLPEAAAGFARGEVATESATAGGFGTATAEADYLKGASRVTLRVVDTSGVGPMAGMLAAFSIERSSERGGEYEKVGRVDGRMTMEKYDRDARRGEYAVVVADRFLVQAEGRDVSMDQLKALVRGVDRGALERLGR